MNTNTNGDIRNQFLHLEFIDRPAVEGSERGHFVICAHPAVFSSTSQLMKEELQKAFAENRVAVHFSNTSGLGVENDWWEARFEESRLAANYMIFATTEMRDTFVKLNTTMSRVPAEAQRRFDYIMYGRA